VFGTRGDPSRCQCQRFKIPARRWDKEWASGPVEERTNRPREQTRCGHPEPRTAYVRLGRVPWAGRAEDRTDDGVWAVTWLRHPHGLPPPRRQPCPYCVRWPDAYMEEQS